MIPFKRYIDIVSGVGGGAGVRLRDLITRLFTGNNLVSPGGQLEFADADAVGVYFGTDSEEYKRAAFYFGFVSKNITAPNKISFARWANVAVPPQVWGGTAAKALATFTAMDDAELILTMGADTNTIGPVDLSACASLAAVAAALQVAIRAEAGAQFVNATVTFDAQTNRFNLAGTVAAAAAMVVAPPVAGTDVTHALGWTINEGAIINAGSAVESVAACLGASIDASNNFASFAFIPALTTDEAQEAATWNDGQNNMFLFLKRAADLTEATTLFTDCGGLSGMGVTLAPLADEYPELLPGMVLAATDYARRGATQNYMFQQEASLTPSVTTGADADGFDGLRCNYVGETQTAGQGISFYQRGVLFGGPQDAVDMNTYANEIWFKDAAGAALLSLFLSLGKVSANLQGRSQLVSTLSTVIRQALDNGVISIGKTLSNTQKLFIGNLTGDPLAWLQVQNLGYWLDVVMRPTVTQDGRTEWTAVYTLIYSKDDAVRKVDGSHVMI